MDASLARAAVAAALRTGQPAPLAAVPLEAAWTAIASEDVAGLLSERLHRTSPLPLPPALAARLAQAARVAAGLEAVREHETRRVLAALAPLGATPVLFKGTALAYTVYAAPHERPRADTDLLLPQEAAHDAARALAGLGYHEPPFCTAVHHQQQLERIDATHVRHAVDLHWSISAQAVFASLVSYDELLAEAEPLPALGPHARAAGRVHALLLACVHPVMHHRNAIRLLWLADIDRLATTLSAGAWEQLASLAVDRQVAAIVAHSLGLAHATLGTPLPAAVVDRLAAVRGEPSARYLATNRRWLDEVADSIRALPGWPERLQLLRSIAFPPAAYMRARYDDARRARPPLPVLYARRLLQGGWLAVTNRK